MKPEELFGCSILLAVKIILFVFDTTMSSKSLICSRKKARQIRLPCGMPQKCSILETDSLMLANAE